jgi:hypothetical protein
LWYGPVATGVPVLQRFALVVLRVDRKRRVGQQQQSLGILFQEIIFSFSRFSQRANAFRWLCGLRVDRRADQPKQVARLVPCGMVQLQPGYQSCNDLRLPCCASIANDESDSNNSLLEFFFKKLFFPFLFSRKEQTRFGGSADCASTDVQISRSRWQDLCLVVWSSCYWDVSLAAICACCVRVDCKRRVGQQQQNSFSNIGD